MLQKPIALLLMLFTSIISFAQDLDLCKIAENEALQHKMKLRLKSGMNSNYDVSYYHINLKLNPQLNYIDGNVEIHLKATMENVRQLSVDLSDSLKVDSILFNGQLTSFTRDHSNSVQIELMDSLTRVSLNRLQIFYQGIPQKSGLGSFSQGNRSGESVIWTLSQPYGAQDWWPCKNNLSDKADSVAIDVEVPLGFRVASNGLLLGIDSSSNMHRYRWKTNYPIAPYLVGVAVADYDFYEEKVKLGSDSLLMYHFLYKDETLVQSNNAVFTFFSLFDSLFGSYPFIKEKYGHASYTNSGGIEHQTMSFMGNYGGELVAHEAAHQWFGNKVTCGSWQDLWLNEGFATYLTAITYEFNVVHSIDFWPIVKQNLHNTAFNFPHSSVFQEDTTVLSELFNQVAYQKGASLLHMLRWKIGDDAFFRASKNYLNDPKLAYSFARTYDFKRHLELSSNQNLDEFFKDWFYGRGYPTYTTQWQQSNGQLHLTIEQSPSDPSVYFFNIPIPYRLHSGSWDSTIIIAPSFSGQDFSFKVSRDIDSLVFDPEDWILAKHDFTTSIHSLSSQSSKLEIIPNPSRDFIKIKFTQNLHSDKIRLYNISGKSYKIEVQNNLIDLKELRRGLYLLHIQLDKELIIKKIILI